MHTVLHLSVCEAQTAHYVFFKTYFLL